MEQAGVGSNRALLRVAGIAKSFGPTPALRDCSLEVLPRMVHAVIGENGSGKSTLVKILSGVHTPDRGTLWVDGQELRGFATPRQSGSAGIATVFQEVLIARKRSVLENIWMGTEGIIRRGLSVRLQRDRAGDVLTSLLGAALPLDVSAGALSLSEQQACVIARALVREPRVLILDEATSALDIATRDRLFEMVRAVSANGAGVIFISHRMDEVETLGDRITVLRSGESVATLTREDATPSVLVHLMTGAERLIEGGPVGTPADRRGAVVITTSQLRLRPGSEPIDLAVRAGEIVGIGGLEGHGQDELLRALRGEAPWAGQVVRQGSAPVVLGSPRSAARHGVAYVPRDRRLESVFPTLSTQENFAVPTLADDTRKGILRRRLTEQRFGRYVERLAISQGRSRAPITSLSGGNQQKVVIARWLAANPDVLLLNDPTRGVDLGAKRDIYALLRELASRGVAVVMLSTELDELVELMDRVLVFREGHVFWELSRETLSRQTLLAAFFGHDPSRHA